MKKQETKLHIGKLIRKHLEEIGMTKSEFARRIDTSPQNIYGIFKRESCDTNLLKNISDCLKFDFFGYYSSGSKIIGGELKTATDMQKEISELTKELDQIKAENGYLKEIHELQKKK